jgi:tetratricopeptide (TPR) repeat protein
LQYLQSNTVSGFKFFRKESWRSILVVGFLTIACVATAELPKTLADAIEQSQTEEGMRVFGVLSRYAHSDNSEHRLESRVSLAELDRKGGNLDRALTWVAEYQSPQAENYEWPRVRAYIEAAKIQFESGNTFDSVKRLLDADKESSGMAKVNVQRAISWLVEQKPDLVDALRYEKSALKTGSSYFKRMKISDSAGKEPPKLHADKWEKLKPMIEERIAFLERKIDVEKYGLDYVLYREAQGYRNASHPLAMDFTNVAAAFGEDGEIGGKVPNVDYDKAIELYQEIIEFFPDNPYGQAAKLYVAVCTAKKGDVKEAIKQLRAFYKEDPDGLMRGEALKILGDLYLFANWDKVNAREAYGRTVRWAEAIEGRARILDTYLVPEKSEKISAPPVRVKILTDQGEIKEIIVPSNALVNRLASEWYLDSLVANTYWKLGFIHLVDDDWDKALSYFEQTLVYDEVLRKANETRYFNPYDRLKIGKKVGAIVGTKEQSRGLNGKIKAVMFWADFKYLLGVFDESRSVYGRIKELTKNQKEWVVYSRAALGEALLDKTNGRDVDVRTLHEIVMDHPRSPSAPFLLEICAQHTEDNELTSGHYYRMIYENYPESFFAPRAYFNQILNMPWDKLEEIDHEISEFKRRYPKKESYVEGLSSFYTFISSNETQEGIK